VAGPNDEVFIKDWAHRYLRQAPAPSDNPIIRRLQRGSEWSSNPSNLTSPQAAIEWVRSRASIDRSRPSLKNLFRLRTDWRLTPESLPMLLDILSSDDGRMVLTAIRALSFNGAQCASDETEDSDATVHIVTLPDGSIHERPDNMTTFGNPPGD